MAYLEGKVFLKELGMDSDDEIAKVLDIAMNPDSLFLSPAVRQDRSYVVS